MSFLLGLTGSIGMGKSTTAKMFAEAGCALWDADAAVHRLYAKGGKAVSIFAKKLPEAVMFGEVSRDALKQMISDDPTVLKEVEAIVHPLVAQDRAAFIENATADILVFDIPLLFETGGNVQMDAVVTVTAPAETQKQRVLARGTMTEAQFLGILAKQMPDAEKRARSDYIVETTSIDAAKGQVLAILEDIKGKRAHA